MNAEELVAFEAEVAAAFKEKRIRGPIHLSGGNEAQLLDIFTGIKRDDWVFCSYRQHYHALLHGIPRDEVMAQIMAGRSMGISSVQHRFYSTAIVAGQLAIAVGVALALKQTQSAQKVWCFCGDMAATTGAFDEAHRFARGHQLPIKFIVENNRLSVNTPTMPAWGFPDWWPPRAEISQRILHYLYTRPWPHSGINEWVRF